MYYAILQIHNNILKHELLIFKYLVVCHILNIYVIINI